VAFDPPIDAGGLDWGFWYRAGPPLEAAPFYRLSRRTSDTSSVEALPRSACMMSIIRWEMR